MRQSGKALICLAGLCLCCTGAQAISSGNPYQGIVDRNVFGLRAPPPPPDTSKKDEPQPVKIIPTGLTTILGNKRVLFKVSQPPKPPMPAQEMSYILAEGQREGEIEVLEIDEKAGAIKFNNHGTVVTLTLDKDGAKLPASPAPAVAMPAPVAPVMGQVPQPTVTPGMPNQGLGSIPTRTLRLPGANVAGADGVNPANPGSLGFGGYNPQRQPTQQDPQITGEEATIIMEAERLRLRSKGDPMADLIPPTEISPLNPNQNPNQDPGLQSLPGRTRRSFTPSAPGMPPVLPQ